MTNEQKAEAYRMRLDGKSYQEIGKQFGCTRQNVENALRMSILKPNIRSFQKCPYVGLKRFLVENKVALLNFAKKLEITEPTARRRISGETSFTIREIRVVLQLTGMTFEECFAETEDVK